MLKVYPRRKSLDMEMNPVKGDTPRSSYNVPNKYKGQKIGTDTVDKIKTGKIPNKKG